MTIKDIAERCGVSVTTVSRVLNGHPYVREEIREKVQKALEETHFVRNPGAMDLAKTQENNLGLVVRGRDNPFFGELLPRIEAEVARRGYGFSVTMIHAWDDEMAAAVRMAKRKKLRGMILLGGQYDYTAEKIAALQVPFVCCTFSNRFGSLPSDAYSAVSMDDRAIGRACTQRLIDLGHRRIALIGSEDDERSIGQLRREGFLLAMEENGVAVDPALVKVCGAFRIQEGYEAAWELIRSGARFTALFAISDMMALGAMKALHEAGVRVPEDCSVMGIDGLEVSRYAIPTLTTMVQPQEELARRSVEVLADILEQGASAVQVVVEPVLREGASIAPPPQ